MAQEDHSRRDIAAALARKAAAGADAEQIAAAVTATMGAIEASLRPIIGNGGVVAMYRRSLLLVGAAHPWLASGEGARSEIELDALRSLLAAQDAAGATTAGAALLQTFCDLLASLIGSALSERLLRNVWVNL